MDNMMRNMNINNIIDKDILEIIFSFDNYPQKVKCLNDELFESVIKRYCKNFNYNRNMLDFFL